ncbi:CotH kinase family protein [Larkinella terrae]|uniref:T9SS type A sorting domain-containing protein n=1 Tax=Larkinella terrae TaxID=2025311 RepID=A0A7K0EJV0_9BACT|nr:CotH kinase family protein [Larkinella terrae]MRS62087.1 T9SS type A sorting domain-containing protein [Larkinella terrae]
MNPFYTPGKSVYFYLIWFSLFRTISLNAQPIAIASADYQVDNNLKLIICNKIPAIPTTAQPVTLIFDKNYSYAATGAAFQLGKEYSLSSSSGTYKLFFTSFPIFIFNTNGVAISNDDNRTKGTVSISDGNSPSFSASMGIRIRGNTSRLYPKKSYNMELWKDPNGNEELEKSLFGMREDSKWLFLAMYNEPLRVNNSTAWAIWLKMHQLYYTAQEPGALAGIRTRYCDVFVNNSYNGVYLITEDLDRKQLKLKKTKDNGDMRGELYKSGAKTDATAFTSVFNNNALLPYDNNSATWSGYEMDYPKLPYWNNLFGLVSFITKSSDSDFRNQVGGKFKVDNLIDVFLFLNAIGATEDNFGNNQFFARYKENEPYMLLPWDFDISMGNISGKMDGLAEAIRTNGFFYRLMTLNPNGFKSKMRKRWFALRQGELATVNFKKNFTDNTSLLTNEGAYIREELRWPSTMRLQEQSAIGSWIDSRLAFLDQYFGEFPEQDASAVEVTLPRFSGQISGSEKALLWTTSFEKDASRFEVEFSSNGSTFTKVGQVAASGTSSSEKTYNFTHPDASAPVFYRLKIFNKEELFKYSNVIVLGGCPTPPAAPTISASLTAVNLKQSTVLKATGCANTVVWNTGQTGSQITASPTSTTVYQATCRQSIGCESSPSAPVTVTMPIAAEGFLNTATCTTISGWAWDANRPNTPVMVELLDGPTVIASSIAPIYRLDLKTAGKGNGLHAYDFAPPKILFDNKPHVLTARVQGTTAALKTGSKTITCALTNSAPQAPELVSMTAMINTAFSWTLPMFFDVDYGTVLYSLSGLPAGLSFAPVTREITGTPTVSGTFSLTYSANDGQTTTPAYVSLVVGLNTFNLVNQPPVAPAVSPLAATVSSAFTATLPVFTDTDPLTYALAGLPGNLGFNPANRQITGTPTTSGTFSLTYTASDGQSTTPVFISLVVSNTAVVNQAPQAPSVAPLSATVNAAFSTTLPVFTDTDPLTYALSSLPNALTFNASTRQLTGTPTVSGAFSLTYSATDTQSASNFVVVSLTISPAVSEPPPMTVTGNFEGYLDKVECGSIRGWVWDRNKPNTAFTVEFFANGSSIGTAKADIFRQDLKDAGKGNGSHVYTFPTPASVKTGTTYQISAKVQNSNYVLSWSPKTLNCPVGSRLNGEDDAENASGLTVWPNPSNGTFEIHYDLKDGKSGELSIIDASGRDWYRKSVGGEGPQRQRVSLAGADGIFLIQLRQGKTVQNKKIVINQ